MSIKRWKQIITISVIAIIVLLFVLAIYFGLRSKHYENLIEESKLIDLTKYQSIDTEKVSGVFNYLEAVETSGKPEYAALFPNLYVENDFEFVDTEEKVCYLTFDDGPNTSNTPRILDTLKKYGIKATFFVVYTDDEDANKLYKRIVDEGHTIAVHTASHDYDYIYSSVEAYLTDFEKMSSHIEDVTGVKPEIFRFPGGSVNTYNVTVYKEIIAEMLRRGYVYYDWNVSAGDASPSRTSKNEIIDNVLSVSANQDDAIVLLHDGPGHDNTTNALPEIIEGLTKQGYTFASLDNSVAPWCFGY